MSEAVDSQGELYCPTCEQTYARGDRCPRDDTRLVKIANGTDRMLGRELDGRYTIVESIGHGGMGTVYRGTQHSVGREVAIKVVTPGLVADPVVIKRFLREAKLASRLTHPNAVSVLDFGQTSDGLFYLVMELVSGRTLDRVIAADGALPPPRVVRIGAQICDALEGAHELYIVHRDLKPQNVMVMSTGRDLVKVLDFGLAKSLTPDGGAGRDGMTNAGGLLGTPAFMPPEIMAGGDGGDARADLYSLGCVLHFAATGRAPFEAGSVHELIAMHASDPVPMLDGLPRRLAAVIEKLLAKDPIDRYQSAAETREALEDALTIAAAPATPAVGDDEATSVGPPVMLGWDNTSVRGNTSAIPLSMIPHAVRLVTPPVGVRVQAPAAARVATPPAGVRVQASPAIRVQTPGDGAAVRVPSSPAMRAVTPPAGERVPSLPAMRAVTPPAGERVQASPMFRLVVGPVVDPTMARVETTRGLPPPPRTAPVDAARPLPWGRTPVGTPVETPELAAARQLYAPVQQPSAEAPRPKVWTPVSGVPAYQPPAVAVQPPPAPAPVVAVQPVAPEPPPLPELTTPPRFPERPAVARVRARIRARASWPIAVRSRRQPVHVPASRPSRAPLIVGGALVVLVGALLAFAVVMLIASR